MKKFMTLRVFDHEPEIWREAALRDGFENRTDWIRIVFPCLV